MRRLLISALAGLLGLAGAAGLWWYTHPTAFPSLDDGPVGTSARVRIGQPVHVAMTYPTEGMRPRDVHLLHAYVNVEVNSAHATSQVRICDPDARTAIASYIGPRSRVCKPLWSASGTDLTLGGGSQQQLMLTLVPTSPGTVRVRGVDLRYRAGWQRGTQTIGDHVALRVPTRFDTQVP